MNRLDFQKLARIRVREAKALIDRGLYEGAYYLAGYSVEYALKACIARQTKKYDFPDKKRAEKSHTHNLGQLLEQAALKEEHRKRLEVDKQFELRWAVVKDWTEQSRYETADRQRALELYRAIVNRNHGVLTWLKQRW